MARKIVALILLALLTFAASAQDDACSIMIATYSGENLDITLYKPEAEQYVPVASLTLPSYSVSLDWNAYNENIRFVVDTWEDSSKRLDIYKVSDDAILQDGSIETNLQPHNKGWSPSGRYMLLFDEDFYLNRELYIYDTLTGIFARPTELSHIWDVSWSPTEDILVFKAYRAFYRDAEQISPLLDYGIYVTDAAGTLLYKQALRQADSNTYIQWLTGRKLGLTTCVDFYCHLYIVDVSSGGPEKLALGSYLPTAYVAWRDGYVVWSWEDGGNIGLWSALGDFTPYTSRERVVTEPVFAGGRYVSARLETGGQPKLLIIDMFDSKLRQVISLEDGLPQPDYSTHGQWRSSLGFHEMDRWNAQEQKLIYHDSRAVHVYDVAVGREIASFPSISTGQWVCPSVK